MDTSLSQKAVIYAYEKGYRVTDDGLFLNPKGNPLPVKVRSNHKYPQTQVRMDGKNCNYHVHRLAAFCFFGDELFKPGVEVRHLSGNVLDVSRQNIALGSRSENEQDKPARERSARASSAVKCRKDTRRLTMRRFTDAEIRDIRARLKDGEVGADIAREFSVTKDTIYHIRRGKNYADVV